MIAARVERSPGVLAIGDRDGEVLRATAEVLLTDGRSLSTRDDNPALVWDLQKNGPECIVVRLRFRNTQQQAVRIEQLRPLVAEHGYRHHPLSRLRIQQTGWQSWSRSHPLAPFEPNLQTAAPPIRGPWLPHRRPTSQVEPWMTILQPGEQPAVLLGFIAARSQLGTLEIIPSDVGGHAIVAATELEGVSLAPGDVLVSEPLLIATGPAPALLDLYAASVAAEMVVRPSADVLTGWCSWYQLYTGVSHADVERNLTSLAARRDLLPLRLIQLDDGYERAVGDWLEPNDRFPRGMRPIVQEIQQRGYLAGLWLAPFLLSAQSHTLADHPDWVVRDAAGAPLNAIDNWGSANYALDTTNPAALDWLEHVVHVVCDDWGFDYLKLDFLYAGALRGTRFASGLTANAAFRLGMERLRRAAGERFILGCGAPLLPSVGLVDGMRIGSDVANFWGREGNADGPSLRNATRATLARLWLHGRWWTNDPDCVIIRADDTQLSLAEVQGWASVVAFSGGMVFVGDDVSRVEESRLALLARLLPPSGQAAHALEPLVGSMPEHLHLRVERSWGAWSVVGIANWSDAPTFVGFDPGDFHPDLVGVECHVVDLGTGEYLGRHVGRVQLGQLAAHAMRVLAVHPNLGRPQTIGSTGHLLGDAMDLACETWDADSGVLMLTPGTDGPPARQGELIVADPAGPVRRVAFSVGGPTLSLKFGVV